MFTEKQQLKLVCEALQCAVTTLYRMPTEPTEMMGLEDEDELAMWGVAQQIALDVTNGREFDETALCAEELGYFEEDGDLEYDSEECKERDYETVQRLLKLMSGRYLEAPQ